MIDLTDNKQVRAYIKENKIADLSQLNTLLKTISGVFIEEILEAERDEQIGYPKHSKSETLRASPHLRNPRIPSALRSNEMVSKIFPNRNRLIAVLKK